MADSDKRRHTLAEHDTMITELTGDMRAVEGSLVLKGMRLTTLENLAKEHTGRLDEQYTLTVNVDLWKTLIETELLVIKSDIKHTQSLTEGVDDAVCGVQDTYQKKRNIYDWAIIVTLVANAAAWFVHYAI